MVLMLEITDEVASILLSGSQKRRLRVESWYDDQLLDDDIPVSVGQEEVDRGSGVPERVTFTVPRLDHGTDYTPAELLSPLAANGQVLRVSVGVGVGLGQYEWLQRGWYVVVNSEARKDAVEVECAGLLYKIQEARLVNPLQPSGTFQSTIRALVEPGITVDFDSALIDRAVPASVNFDDDRLQALQSTLTAWPATADVTPDGYLYVTTAEDMAVSVLTITDGVGGTVIEARGKSTRDGVFNAVVAQGTASDGALVRGVAYDLTGPKRSGGPFNELPVPLYYDSPLITTQAQANSAATSRMKTLKRGTALTYDVEMVSHPALLAGDRLTVVSSRYGTFDAIIEVLSLPLLAAGGSMDLVIRRVET